MHSTTPGVHGGPSTAPGEIEGQTRGHPWALPALSICRGSGQAPLPGASDHAPLYTSKHWEARPSRWSHHTPCQIPSLFTALWGPELANRKPAELTALLYLEIPGATGLSPGRLLGL